SPSAEPTILQTHGAPRSVLVAPGKRWFALADVSAVRLWDTARNDHPFELPLPGVGENNIPSLQASEDGRWLAATYLRGKALEATVGDGERGGRPAAFCRVGGFGGGLLGVQVSPDRQWVAATVGQPTAPSAWLWNLPVGGGTGPGGAPASP